MTADLNYAINNLPETAPCGRMTKGIAMSILLKYRMIQGKFVEAEQLCRGYYCTWRIWLASRLYRYF